MAEQKNPLDGAQSDDDKRITLAYWKIQGLACPARMMLMYAKQDFNNVMYEQKAKGDGYDISEWSDVKYTLGFAFPNLPYLIDSKTNAQFTESRTIYRYIARQFKIGVQEDPQLAIADEIQGKIHDQIRGPFVKLAYGTDCSDEKLAKHIEDTAERLKPFEAFLKGKKFICGDEICYADFSMYYLLSAHRKIKDSFLTDAKLVNLDAFIKNFEALEFMTAWKDSEYSKLPLNNTVAKFR